MIFRTCDYCGAHLDPGEACSCQEEEAAAEGRCETHARPIDNPYKPKKEDITDVIGKEH